MSAVYILYPKNAIVNSPYAIKNIKILNNNTDLKDVIITIVRELIRIVKKMKGRRILL